MLMLERLTLQTIRLPYLHFATEWATNSPKRADAESFGRPCSFALAPTLQTLSRKARSWPNRGAIE
jgi:hypothetical protein